MSEQQLADLFIQMGLERGFTIEQVVDELAAIRLPSYVDQGRFRLVVVAAAEARLRAQFEERLNRLRQQYSVPEPAAPAPIPVPIGQGRVRLDPGAEDATSPPTQLGGQSVPFQASQREGVRPAETNTPEPEMPRDATIFWGNRDGGESR